MITSVTSPKRSKVKAILKTTLVTTALGIPVLIGGNIVDKAKYPGVIRISSNGAGCTASVVGPNVVLTAAHCVDNGAKVSFKHSGLSYTSEGCVHHPGYKTNKTQDFALCKVKDVAAPWISVNASHDFVKVGESLVLSGYGCTNKGGGGGNDGYLRMGEAKVLQVPNTGSNFDIVSKGVAALCFGDSGGPVFKNNKQVAVNSRGNIEDTSFTSATHMADESFMIPWAKANAVEICGLTKSCDGEKETPPEPPKPNPDPAEQSWWEKILFWIAQAIWDAIIGAFSK